jgi:GMP synthase-like glutamine amidotransferase
MNQTPIARTKVLYVTLDAERDRGNASNVAGLTSAARKWERSPPLEVEQVWWGDLQHLDAAALEAKYNPFMLFLAGSFTEWQDYGRNADWARLLDTWCAMVQATRVPILAVCGSHQLLARTFGNGWDAIGHMVSESAADVTIGSELATSPPTDRIPSPRLGEHGTFPFHAPRWAEDDPLLARGLGERVMHFTESHADQVLRKGIGWDFVEIMSPAKDEDALDVPGSTPLRSRDRCKVQALRWVGDERVMYSLQFHPELPIHPDFRDSRRTSPEVLAQAEALGTDGETLLVNFFDVVASYWSASANDSLA